MREKRCMKLSAVSPKLISKCYKILLSELVPLSIKI